LRILFDKVTVYISLEKDKTASASAVKAGGGGGGGGEKKFKRFFLLLCEESFLRIYAQILFSHLL
jgi:hypothetical protein